MKFGIEKCDMLIMKRERREATEGIELSNQICIRMLWEKENYNYLGLLEADIIEQAEIESKIM